MYCSIMRRYWSDVPQPLTSHRPHQEEVCVEANLLLLDLYSISSPRCSIGGRNALEFCSRTAGSTTSPHISRYMDATIALPFDRVPEKHLWRTTRECRNADVPKYLPSWQITPHSASLPRCPRRLRMLNLYVLHQSDRWQYTLDPTCGVCIYGRASPLPRVAFTPRYPFVSKKPTCRLLKRRERTTT